MNTLKQYKEVFIEKLKSSGDFDDAFGKAIWIAYNQGLHDGLTDTRADKTKVLVTVSDLVSSAFDKVNTSNSTITKK